MPIDKNKYKQQRNNGCQQNDVKKKTPENVLLMPIDRKEIRNEIKIG